MQPSRAAALAALSLLLWAAGCTSTTPARAYDAVELRDGSVFRYRHALRLEAIPAAARRTSNSFVQPGGEMLFAGREWGRGVDGFRFDKRFGNAHRSLLVDAAGNVLERSHQIPLNHAPPRARRAAAQNGHLLRVDLMQEKRGTADQYRFSVRDGTGRTRFVFTDGRGSILHHGHLAARK